MRRAPLTLVLAITSLLPACAGRLETTVRKRAAGDFQCAPEQVQVETASAGAMSGSYVARGCGQESEYAARCGLIGICTASQPGAEPAYASSGGSDPGYGGEKPKFGSGTYSSMSSNSSTSKSMRPGEMIWIVDDSENGISSATVEAGTNTVEITGDCSGFSVR